MPLGMTKALFRRHRIAKPPRHLAEEIAAETAPLSHPLRFGKLHGIEARPVSGPLGAAAAPPLAAGAQELVRGFLPAPLAAGARAEAAQLLAPARHPSGERPRGRLHPRHAGILRQRLAPARRPHRHAPLLPRA